MHSSNQQLYLFGEIENSFNLFYPRNGAYFVKKSGVE